MDVVVCLKLIPDPGSVEINRLTGLVDKDRLVYIINHVDLCSLEAALQIKEKYGGTVSVICLGSADSDRYLREVLARGADKVWRIWEYDWENVTDPHLRAFALVQTIKKQPYDLILCGDGGGEFTASQVPAWLAEFLNLPLITSIVDLSVNEGQKSLTVKRKLERGKRQVLECTLPAVLAVTQSLNEPRESSLPNLIASLQSDSIAKVDLLLGTVARMVPIDHNQDIVYETVTETPKINNIHMPDPETDGAERINSLITGGISRKSAEVIHDSPEKAVRRIVEFLKTNDVI